MILLSLSGKRLLSLFPMSGIWRQYKNSMSRRRPESVLFHNAFGRYARRAWALVLVENGKQSFLLGSWEKDMFFASHFCPATQRHGLRLLQAVKAWDQQAVFAVTEDLASMMEKLGFLRVGECMAPFRGQLVKKVVYTNGPVWRVKELLNPTHQ